MRRKRANKLTKDRMKQQEFMERSKTKRNDRITTLSKFDSMYNTMKAFISFHGDLEAFL